MSADGPDHTIIKIKPSLTFTIENAKEVLFYLQKIFGEDFIKIIWDHKKTKLLLLKNKDSGLRHCEEARRGNLFVL
jgi:hypothetical protein